MVADQVATAVLSRPDWYAGRISLDVHSLLRSARAGALEAQAAAAGAEAHLSAAGRIQAAVLVHSILIHKLRAKAVPRALWLVEYRNAMSRRGRGRAG